MFGYFFSIFLVFISYEVNAGVYKCVDENSKVAYQATPCAKSLVESEIRLIKHEASPSDAKSGGVEPSEKAGDVLAKAENCDSKLYGTWKATWWQIAPDGKKSKRFLGDMRWTFLKDNSFEYYNDGFTNTRKLKFSCAGLKISLTDADTNEDISVIRLISITPGEIISSGMGRYTYWNRM